MSNFYAGIDVGSWNTKAVIIDQGADIIGKSVLRTGADLPGAAKKAFAGALRVAKLHKDKVVKIVASGFGRNQVAFADLTRTEITCHGLGANCFYPGAPMVIDIGGQDTKVIFIDDKGRNLRFHLNRKCSAGTGAFLEEMASRLDLDLDELNDLAASSKKRLKLGSFCTVFTGTEILRLVQEGAKVKDIARGLYSCVVARVAEMTPLHGKVVLSGGVIAYNPILKSVFEEETGVMCLIPPEPQFIGALGAARVAIEIMNKG